MPAYGPEMRGGTANVTVIISDEKVNSPVLKMYDTVIALNQQSLDKFEDKVKPGGTLIYDSNGLHRLPERRDINIYHIAAAKEATEMGNPKTFNMIVLGAFLKIKPVVKMEGVHAGLKKSLPARHHRLIPINEQAIHIGLDKIEAINLV
jgi:2-oxoglutarate ferredoxin oxidoreductase subunit gamma